MMLFFFLGMLLLLSNLVAYAGIGVIRASRGPWLRLLGTTAPIIPFILPWVVSSPADSWVLRVPRGWTVGGYWIGIALLLWWTWNAYRLFLSNRAEQEILLASRNVRGLSSHPELAYAETAVREGVRDLPDLLVHPRLNSAMLLGYPPSIVIPATWVPPYLLDESTYWDGRRSEAATLHALQDVIRHELVHLQRRDHLLRWIHGAFFILFGPGLIAPESIALRRVPRWLASTLILFRTACAPIRRLLDTERAESEAIAHGAEERNRPYAKHVALLALCIGVSGFVTPGTEALKFAITGKSILWGYLPLGWQMSGSSLIDMRYGVERLPSGEYKVLLNTHFKRGDLAVLTFIGGMPTKNNGSTTWLAVSYKGDPPVVACVAGSKAIYTPLGQEYGTLLQGIHLKPINKLQGKDGWTYSIYEGQNPEPWLPQAKAGDRSMDESRVMKVALTSITTQSICIANPETPHE